jgi:Methyl-accepting chemotaxis protein (MCP) signalling domain
MTIRSKLILSFSLVACVPLVGGAIGLYAHRSAMQRVEQLSSAALQGFALLKDCRDLQAELSSERAEWTGGAKPDSDTHGAATEVLPRAGAIDDRLNAIKLRVTSLGLAPSLTDAVTKAQTTLNTHAKAGTVEIADFARSEAAAVDLLNSAHRQAVLALRADDSEFATFSQLCDTAMGIGTLVGVAMGVTFGVLMSIAVTRHIVSVARHMWDETSNVAAAASQVAISSRDLAAASSQQAASVEETSASLLEVNTIVRNNAEHAREARSISHENRQTSDRSATEIAALQTAMQEMAAANANIAKIVQSIDEIAFQTNILALNAAVEAARAGESGAGFAVVAEEVRSLAQRSAVAARETGVKIDDVLNKSRRGVEIATRVEASLRKIIADNRRVDGIVEQIAEASVEQSKGLDVAVQAMERIDQLTQSNTASAEQTATAAQQLDGQTRTLRLELSGLMDRKEEPEPTRPLAVAVAVAVAAQ